jgi:hypothetical protein
MRRLQKALDSSRGTDLGFRVLKTNPSADPITGKPRTPDADRMVLVCNPGA